MGKKERKSDGDKKKLSELRAEQKTTMKNLTAGMAVFILLLAVAAKLFVDPSQVQNLRVTDTRRLTEILFGGEPWLIQCANASAAPPQTTVTEEAAKAFRVKSPSIRVGTVDCDAKLPESGQSIYKRFFKSRRPAYFTSANGNALAAVPVLQTASSTAIVKHVLDATKPRLLRISGDHDLQSKCLKRSSRPCILLLTRTTSGLVTRYKGIEKLIVSQRATPFAWMNTSKYDISLPGLENFQIDSVPAVVLMKNKTSDSRSKSVYFARALNLEEGVELTVKHISKFLEEAKAGYPPMEQLSKKPTVRSIRSLKREAKIPRGNPKDSQETRKLTESELKEAFERKEKEDQLIWDAEEDDEYEDDGVEEEDEVDLVIL